MALILQPRDPNRSHFYAQHKKSTIKSGMQIEEWRNNKPVKE